MSLQRTALKATLPFRYIIDTLTYRVHGDTEPLRRLKGIHTNKPMLVVGNGPSLNKTPLYKFVNLPAIGMNKIDLLYGRTIWRPSCIVCVNNAVAKQHQDSFAASSVPVYVAWKARWMIRAENRHKIYFFPQNYSSEFSLDPERGFGTSASVTYIALQMAYWMGANPVILFGIDHSFKFSGPTATYQTRKGVDENHFDPNYFVAGSIWGTPDLELSECEYKFARRAFETDGRRVLDATLGGKLEIFKKISLEEALAYTVDS